MSGGAQRQPYEPYPRDGLSLFECQPRLKKRSYRLIEDTSLFAIRECEYCLDEKHDQFLNFAIPLDGRRRIGAHFELLRHGSPRSAFGCASVNCSIDFRHSAALSSDTNPRRPATSVLRAKPRFLRL